MELGLVLEVVLILLISYMLKVVALSRYLRKIIHFIGIRQSYFRIILP